VKKRVLDEQRVVKDFLSERELLKEASERGQHDTSKPISKKSKFCQLSIDQFLTSSKIHPKIYSADMYVGEEKELPQVKTVF